MTEQRKNEIISKLLAIAEGFVPDDEQPELTMFTLISQYNATEENAERIGGSWVRENVPELADLP